SDAAVIRTPSRVSCELSVICGKLIFARVKLIRSFAAIIISPRSHALRGNALPRRSASQPVFNSRAHRTSRGRFACWRLHPVERARDDAERRGSAFPRGAWERGRYTTTTRPLYRGCNLIAFNTASVHVTRTFPTAPPWAI